MSQRKRDRQEIILTELRARPSTRLGELAELFGVSKETIRRDITELSERGAVARTYGGALPSYLNYEPDVRERTRVNPDGRRRMAEVVDSLITDCAVVMIDAGATTSHVCERLATSVSRNGKSPGLTVITNSLKSAMILGENPAIRIVACPGQYDEHEMAAFGPMTLEFLERFRADAMITSTGGLVPAGAMDPNSDAAAVKRTMMKQSARSIFVIENRKFDLTQFELVAPLSRINDLVTDEPVGGELGAALNRNDVRVHVGA